MLQKNSENRMQYKQDIARRVYIFCLALLSSFAVLSKPIIPSYEDAAMLTNGFSNSFLIFLAKLRIYLEQSPSLGLYLFIFILLFYVYCERNKKITVARTSGWGGTELPPKKNHIIIGILSMILASTMLVGKSIKQYGDLSFLFSSCFQIVLSISIWVGYTIFFAKTIFCLFELIDYKCSVYCCDEEIQTGKSIFIRTFVLLLVCWLPYWIAYYPGSVMWDPYLQFDQYFGVVGWSDWHPVFSTAVYGFIMSLGRNIANDNCGIFLCALYQHILLAGAISYGMYILRRWGIRKRVRNLILAFFCIHPLIAFQAQSVMKDISYYAFILCFSITYLDLLRDISRKEEVTRKKYVLLAVTAILASLMRHNGIYCCLLSLFFLLFKNRKKDRLNILAILGIIIVISGCISNGIIKYTNASPKSQGEMMSIPFQQIARFVKCHGDELSEEDRETIDEVLQYDNLSEKYNPEISDPVKSGYKSTPIVSKFFSVWLKCFAMHPSDFFEAFFCNTYTYYYPDGESNIKPLVYNSICEDVEVNTGYFDIHYTSSAVVRNGFNNTLYLLLELPGVGILFHQGFYTWLILIFCAYALYKKMTYGLIASVPLIVHILICIVSPVNGYFRYYMPILFIMPFVFSWGMQCQCTSKAISEEIS